MFYKFDKDFLEWKKDSKKMKLFVASIVVVILSSFVVGRYVRFASLDKFEKEVLILNLQKERDRFTEDKLVEELKRLNIRYPHIVMAQSILETGHWKSQVFKSNHNLFGMKQANIRINTAKGTNLNHAYYENWQESLYDYAFYQCRYMSNARTEEEYFLALNASYAEVGGQYSIALKNVIEKEKLREKFE